MSPLQGGRASLRARGESSLALVLCDGSKHWCAHRAALLGMGVAEHDDAVGVNSFGADSLEVLVV